MTPVDASQRTRTEAEWLAMGLGWFSIGLGVAETLAPRGMARLIGSGEDSSNALRMLGLREIAHGVGILSSQPRPSGAVMSRVAGDMLDLAFLGSKMLESGTNKTRLCGAMTAVAGVAALDLFCSQQLAGSPRLMSRSFTQDGHLHVSKAITVNRPPEEVRAFWHNFSNLPRFMYHLKSVDVLDGGRSRWVARGPLGREVRWEAELTEDTPGHISWRSLPGADVENSGSVSFERGPGGRGTTVRVKLEYVPPGGAGGTLLAQLTGEEPEQQIYDDLRRFKQVMEIGEVVRSDASITRAPRAAQPPKEALREVMA